MRVVLIALAVAACATEPGPTIVAVPTGSPWPGTTPPPCPAAITGGTLVDDADFGLVLTTGDRRVKLVFPFGYHALDVGDGQLALVDGGGTVIAYEGNSVYVGGGFMGADESTWNACGGISSAALSSPRP